MSFCSVSTDSVQSSQNPPSTSSFTSPLPTTGGGTTPPGLTSVPARSDDNCGVTVTPPVPPPENPLTYAFVAVDDRVTVEMNSVVTFNVGTGAGTASQTPDYLQATAVSGTTTKLAFSQFKILSDNSSTVPTIQGVVTKSSSTEGEYTFTPATGFTGVVDNWYYTATDLGTSGVTDSSAIVSIRVVEPGVLSNSIGLSWKGIWEAGRDYNDGLSATNTNRDVVKLADTGAMFVCIQSHTSDYGKEPQHSTTDTPTPWPEYWEMMVEDTVGATGAVPQQSFLESLYSGTMDWMKTATIGDWIQAVAIGAGIVVAGSLIMDAIVGDGGSSTDNDVRYSGSPTYLGAYTAPTLKYVVETLCLEAGITNYDTSQLSTDIKCHFSLAQTTSVRTILDNLSKAFQFDMVDSSGTLKFVSRNTTPVRTLVHDDMGFNSSGDNVAPVTMKRLQSIDLPRKVTLTYIAEDLDYNNYSQSSEIPTFAAGNDVSLSVPFMLSHADAKDATDKLLIDAHLERMQYTFKCSYKNALDLEPGDVVQIPEGLVRIVQIEEVDEGVLEIHCVDAGATGAPQPIVVGGVTIGYTASTYVGTGLDPQLPEPVLNAAPNITKAGCFFIDPPVMSSDDTSPRVYAAVHGYGVDGWPGAQIFISKDGGGSYTQIAQQNTSSTWGLVEAITPASQNYYFDDTTQIVVKVKTGTLSSKPDATVYAGENLCMVGREVIAFGVATLTAPGTYTLSHLLRGRHGTEWACGNHEVNELFVLLNNTLVPISIPESDRGKSYLFKVVTLGSDLTKVDAQSVQILGENLIPWTATNLQADKVNSEWFLSWRERPRFANELKDYSEISHDPDFGGYAVLIYNGSTVVRQLIVYEPSFVYTLAMQTSDFGSVQTSIKFGINQISNKFGGSRQTLNI